MHKTIRTFIVFILIAIVHAALTRTLTNYYYERSATILLNSIEKDFDSNDEIDFEKSQKDILDQTKYISTTLSFLYMPTWPIWNLVSAISSDSSNLDKVSYQKQKEKSKNIFNIFIITNSTFFSICLWLCYKIIKLIKPRKKQRSIQQTHIQ